MAYNDEIERGIEAQDLSLAAPEREPQRQYYFIKKCREKVASLSKEAGRPLRACTVNMGCQMNARDSEKLSGILRAAGYEMASSEEGADFVIYNTCTVRENANNKVYGHLGRMSHEKKKNPAMKIALCGCMTQEPSAARAIVERYGFVDLVFGTHNAYKFAELLFRALESDGPIVEIEDDPSQIVEDLPAARKYPFKSGVNIMFGCDNFCSYCIVPYVRGRERSREPGDILREIGSLAGDGCVEVMLLGQNVNSYGKGLREPTTFAGLLRDVEKVDGIERIRFMTSHPKDLSDELIGVMAESKKVCRHIHLPLQSGSSRILSAMNRHYDKEGYVRLAERIREAVPGVSITTDIIVGFPGETEEDFEETLEVVERVRFDSAFTFLYSKRAGTPAASMEGQVDGETARERFDRLLSLVQRVSAERAGLLTGRTLPVLIEEENRQDSSLLTGRLSNNSIVHVPGPRELIGKIVDVTLTCCKGFYYFGNLA